MAFAGDAANFVLGGIPADIRDILNPDVDPGDLQRAATAMADVAETVASAHLHLNDSVAMLRGRWEGSGATAFQTDIWQPLSDGLDVLGRESHNAAYQLANLAGQAAEAHMQKIMAIEQEVQTQLNITAVTWELTPAAGKAIAGIAGEVAGRIAGDVVNQTVRGIANALDEVVSNVLAAFAKLFQWLAGPFATNAADIADQLGRLLGVGSRTEQPGSGVALSTDAGAANVASSERTRHILKGDATGGGHLWPGKSGKSPFPASWSADKIMSVASDIATDPNAIVISQVGRRTIIAAERDGVRILVVTDGKDIITAYPTNLPRNP